MVCAGWWPFSERAVIVNNDLFVWCLLHLFDVLLLFAVVAGHALSVGVVGLFFFCSNFLDMPGASTCVLARWFVFLLGLGFSWPEWFCHFLWRV